jgi:hypothetical protein
MTAAVERCERSDLFPSDCGHCRTPDLYAEDVRREKRRLEQNAKPKGEPLLGDWFKASYPGRCSRCPKPFEAGAEIRADFPRELGYISKACHETARPKRGEAA